jgi:hypothetical protein
VALLLIIIVGTMGSGKTLLMTHFATKINNKPIYSNYEIKVRNYKKLEAIDLVNLPNDIEVFLDEGYAWLESRISSSLLNRYMSYLLLQSRKRQNNFYITAQLFSSIDKRFRLHSDILILAKKVGLPDNPRGFKYSVMNIRDNKFSTLFFPINKARKLFRLYDTTEIIKPFNNSQLKYNIIKDDSKLLMKMSNELANKIKPNLKKITHNTVKLAIIKEGLDKNFEPMVYTILKEEQENV